MEIILFENRYRIDVENIVLKLESQLLINLKNTPGVTQSEIENYPKDIRGHFNNVIDNLLCYYQNPDSIVIDHTNKFVNVESTLRNQYTDFTEEKLKKMKEYQPTQYKKEVVRFIDSFAIEFHTFFSPEYKIKENSLPNKFEDDTNLTHSKEIKEFLDKFIPDYTREYRSPFFDFLKDYIKPLNRSELSVSIQVKNKNKEEFEKFIDNVFSIDSMITDKQKKHLKTFFHFHESESKQITPILFEVDEDAAFYIAFFIKKAGASTNSIVNIISKVSNVTDWLNANIKVKSIKGNWSNFKNYHKQFKKIRRVKKMKSISERIINHK